MFFLITIHNFLKIKEVFENFYCYNKQLTKNKYLEFELTKYTPTLLELEVDLRVRGRDHAGVFVSLCVFGYAVSVRVYDHRHWDYKNDQWEVGSE